MSDDKFEAIRELNDKFRVGDITVPGRWMFTAGVMALLKINNVEPPVLIALIGEFDQFDADNDPFREHDFGMMQYLGEKLFWKFDYYGHDLKHGSDDPSDILKTFRVLTIMLAREY